MKVKLLETVQGAGVSGVLLHEKEISVTVLEPGEEYEVDDSLGAWLLEHRKAVEIDKEPVHYGGQKKAALRHDEKLHEQMTKTETGPVEEESESEDEPIMTTENQATTKKTKRGKK